MIGDPIPEVFSPEDPLARFVVAMSMANNYIESARSATCCVLPMRTHRISPTGSEFSSAIWSRQSTLSISTPRSSPMLRSSSSAYRPTRSAHRALGHLRPGSVDQPPPDPPDRVPLLAAHAGRPQATRRSAPDTVPVPLPHDPIALRERRERQTLTIGRSGRICSNRSTLGPPSLDLPCGR